MQEFKPSHALTSTKQRRWIPPIWAYAVTSLYVLALVLGTHLPDENIAVKSTISLVQGDKAAHFLGFLGLSILVFGLCGLGGITRSALFVGIGLALFATIDELTQPFVGRSAEFSDWLCDLLGITVGWTFITFAWPWLFAKFWRETSERDTDPNLSFRNHNETTNSESVTPSKENAQV